jgi:hypothetical protein
MDYRQELDALALDLRSFAVDVRRAAYEQNGHEHSLLGVSKRVDERAKHVGYDERVGR